MRAIAVTGSDPTDRPGSLEAMRHGSGHWHDVRGFHACVFQTELARHAYPPGARSRPPARCFNRPRDGVGAVVPVIHLPCRSARGGSTHPHVTAPGAVLSAPPSR